MRFGVGIVVVLAGSACLETSLPGPPGPGSVQGTLVYFRPGRSTAVPAAGAKVVLKNSSLTATANADGFFRLEPVDRNEGTLLFTFDLDGDGDVDRQKTLTLSAIGAGKGKQTALGQVTLGLNASLSGKVVRDDLGAQRGGHGGTTILVPEGPYATSTSDDGSFLLGELPDGPLQLAYFRDGYDVVVQQVTLSSGEEFSLGTTRLQRTSGTPVVGSLSGHVLRSDGAPLSGVVVHLASGRVERTTATTDQEGAYRFSALMTGVFDIAATREGFATGMIRNLVVAGDAVAGDLVLAPGNSTPPDFVTGAGGGSADGGTGGGATGGGTAGGSTGGGAAGGTPSLQAVIDPSPISVDLTARPDGGVVDFFVDGDRSTGVGPLQYTWEVVNAGSGLELDPPSSTYASRARFFFTGGGVQTHQIRLYVTDASGVQSDWASAQVRAAYRPTVALRPASQLASMNAQVTCTGTDPGNLSLAYRMRIVSGQATLTQTGNRATVASTAANSVVVGCEVENAFGLVSAQEARASITFDPFLAALSVDAGPDLTVDAGTILRLQASATTPGSFVTVWRELGLATPPLQIVPDTQDPLQATITVPQIVGGNSVRRVSLEVISTEGGCPVATCPRVTDEVSLTVLDRTGPSAVRLPSAGHGRFRSLVIEYDEPVVMAPSLFLFKGGGPVSGRTLAESNRRFRFVPDLSLQSGSGYLLQASPTSDATGNVGVAVDAGFVAQDPVLSSSSSSQSVWVVGGALPPAPGVAFLPANGATPSRVLVAGFRAAADQFFSFSPQSAAAPNLGGEMPRFDNSIVGLPVNDGSTHRLFANGQRAVAQLSVADMDGGAFVDGLVLTSQGLVANDWVRLPQATKPPAQSPGPLGADATSLFSLVRTNTQFGVVSNGPQGWSDYVANPSAMEVVFTNNTGNATGQFLGAMASGGGARSVAFFQPPTLFFLARSVGGGAWETFPSSLATQPKAMRVAHVGAVAKVFAVTTQQNAGFSVLRVDSYSGGSAFANEVSPVAGPVNGFDLVRSEAGEHVFLAVASAAGVSVFRRWGNGSTWETVATFGSAGCAFANPELAVTEDEGVFVTWAESCGVQNWYAVLAKID